MSYALITGASSGIGRHYASELASRGHNIIAVSNQPTLLAETAEECGEHLTEKPVTLAIHEVAEGKFDAKTIDTTIAEA